MFERFTDRARKVMQLANQEAQRFNHEYIGTEHILLGLVKEGSGVAANVLKNLDIDLKKVRVEVEKFVQTGPDMVTIGRLPQTPRAKKVIDYSIEEARNLNHNYVGTEHLLLGLLREQEGVAAQVLMSLGLKLHDTMIYEKNSPAYPASATSNRYTQIFEYMFVFAKGSVPKQLICDKPNKWAGFKDFSGKLKNPYPHTPRATTSGSTRLLSTG